LLKCRRKDIKRTEVSGKQSTRCHEKKILDNAILWKPIKDKELANLQNK
jgi:hypothetical protein